MTQISRYIVELYNYMLNIRDTMELLVPKDHSVDIYNRRKKVLTDGIKEGYAFGNFIKNNGEKGKELEDKYYSFIDSYYSDNSSFVKVAGDKLRIDSSQNFKLLTDIIFYVETLKDIIRQFINLASQKNELFPDLPRLLILDDKMYRVVFFMLMFREYEKSFLEFNKVMAESKGAHTPQSNFIVQNELSVMAKALREIRSLNKFTDNELLDLLDDGIKVLEMTEGRRDRIGNKSFKEIFEEINRRLMETVSKIEPEWKACFTAVTNEFSNDIKMNTTVGQNSDKMN